MRSQGRGFPWWLLMLSELAPGDVPLYGTFFACGRPDPTTMDLDGDSLAGDGSEPDQGTYADLPRTGFLDAVVRHIVHV